MLFQSASYMSVSPVRKCPMKARRGRPTCWAASSGAGTGNRLFPSGWQITRSDELLALKGEFEEPGGPHTETFSFCRCTRS